MLLCLKIVANPKISSMTIINKEINMNFFLIISRKRFPFKVKAHPDLLSTLLNANKGKPYQMAIKLNKRINKEPYTSVEKKWLPEKFRP